MPVAAEYPASYTDGQTSALHPVAVRITGGGLLLHPPDDHNRVLAQSSFKNCYVLEDRTEGTPGVFGFRDTPDARLYVHDKNLYGKIRDRLPQEQRSAYKIAFGTAMLAACVVFCAAFIYLMVPAFQSGSTLLAGIVPVSAEERLGEIVLRQVMADEQSCEAEDAVLALTKLGGHIAAAGDLGNEPRILILRNRIPNAFALPGRTILVNSGLLHIARTEEDVAGVLSHEMGHMVHRHALAGFIQDMGLRSVTILVFGDSSLASLSGVAVSLHYNRRMETEADETGARLMSAAGYNPPVLGEFIDFMEKSEKERFGLTLKERKSGADLQKLDRLLFYFSSHPRTEERVARTAALAGQRPAGNFRLLSDAEWQKLKTVCRAPPSD